MYTAFQAEPSPLFSYAGMSAVVEGRIASDPEERTRGLRAVVDVARINGRGGEGKVLAVLPREERVAYGDRVSLRGMLEAPAAFETDTGRLFDYPGYLHARGITLLMPHAQLRAQETGGWSLMGLLYAAKHRFERALERVMREPQASLMEGLLLGEKSGLPDALTDAFVTTGLIHIVVLSGYNIGVVAEWTVRCMNLFLRRRGALVGAGVVIVLFALMAGGGMATVRACLMGVIALMARYLERPMAALRALFVAAAAMLVYEPRVLFDVGFVLSVLATFGLITLSPFVAARLSVIRIAPLREIAATTLAVQVFILPALLYFTGVLSLVALPLNILVLPLVPLAMFLGFLAGSLALLHPYAGLLPGLAGDTLLGGVLYLTGHAAALPLAAAILPPFPAWVAFAAYAPLCVCAIWLYRRSAALSPSN